MKIAILIYQVIFTFYCMLSTLQYYYNGTITEGHHQEWSLRLNLTQHGETHLCTCSRGTTYHAVDLLYRRENV